MLSQPGWTTFRDSKLALDLLGNEFLAISSLVLLKSSDRLSHLPGGGLDVCQLPPSPDKMLRSRQTHALSFRADSGSVSQARGEHTQDDTGLLAVLMIFPGPLILQATLCFVGPIKRVSVHHAQ